MLYIKYIYIISKSACHLTSFIGSLLAIQKPTFCLAIFGASLPQTVFFNSLQGKMPGNGLGPLPCKGCLQWGKRWDQLRVHSGRSGPCKLNCCVPHFRKLSNENGNMPSKQQLIVDILYQLIRRLYRRRLYRLIHHQ